MGQLNCCTSPQGLNNNDPGEQLADQMLLGHKKGRIARSKRDHQAANQQLVAAQQAAPMTPRTPMSHQFNNESFAYATANDSSSFSVVEEAAAATTLVRKATR